LDQKRGGGRAQRRGGGKGATSHGRNSKKTRNSEKKKQPDEEKTENLSQVSLSVTDGSRRGKVGAGELNFRDGKRPRYFGGRKNLLEKKQKKKG